VHAVRDVRRLVVALSRARLGLYVFGKKALFDSCIELGPSFAVLNSKPSRLQLVLNERFPTSRKAEVCVCDLSCAWSSASFSASSNFKP
jgi:intron-binding protein aquarius